MIQPRIKPKLGLVGWNPAAGTDDPVEIMVVPHVRRPGCGNTLLTEEQMALYRLGIMPVRCKSCGELMTDREGA